MGSNRTKKESDDIDDRDDDNGSDNINQPMRNRVTFANDILQYDWCTIS